MAKGIKIENIILKVGSTQIKMTVEEARELQDALNRTFKTSESTKVDPVIIPIPNYPRYDQWYPTWTSGNSSISFSTVRNFDLPDGT